MSYTMTAWRLSRDIGGKHSVLALGDLAGQASALAHDLHEGLPVGRQSGPRTGVQKLHASIGPSN